jgi:putative transposase
LIKPINDILKKSNKISNQPKIKPQNEYTKGKGAQRKKSPDIQKFWTAQHTKCFHEIKALIPNLPVLHLPNNHGEFQLECDSSAKFVGSVLYQIQNNIRHVIAYFRAVMPDAACHYSSSEIELCCLKKAILHFQYLLKYSKFSVLMDHSALKLIYVSKQPPKTNRIQKFISY